MNRRAISDDDFISVHAKGLNVRQAAAHLACSATAVRNAERRLGLKLARGHAFKMTDDQIRAAAAEGLTVDQAARKYRISRNRLYTRASNIGVAFKKGTPGGGGLPADGIISRVPVPARPKEPAWVNLENPTTMWCYAALENRARRTRDAS